jgi:SHS family lactate transporter-like MFS transporter
MPNVRPPRTAEQNKTNARNAVAAAFLGWTLDAFDFFVVVYVVSAIAKDFGRSIPAIALAITASLITRPIGGFIFGLLADRYGRRWVLIGDVIFYSLIEVLSGFSHSYTLFIVLRLLYGVGMGGNWGVGVSLALESVPPKWRGTVSGLLQEGYAVGNGLASIAYFFIFPKFGWRSMFFIGVIPAFITLLLCFRVEESEAWHQAKTTWADYRTALFSNWRRFLYLVALLAAMNFVSHGTQDLYPTFLQRARHFTVSSTAMISLISVVGAIVGGLVCGRYSDRLGRRKTMVICALLGILVIPLWLLAPTMPLIILGAFLMQFMVQGAWGVIPAHINELSPPQVRGFFPGFAYQLGVLIASSISYIEALLGERFSYQTSMGILAAIVLVFAAVIVSAGPENRGVAFLNTEQPVAPALE